MASLASRSATQSLRTAARRAPRALARVSVKPAQVASYSLLAQVAATKSVQKANVQVRTFFFIPKNLILTSTML